MKALIVAPSWIGDTIMAQPLFARLHASHPDLRLDALAPQWVVPVLQRMAEIEEVVASPFGHGQLSLKARWRLARELAARGYDAVYVLPNSLKSALVPFMAGIPRRIGFTGESRFGLINIRHDIDKVALPLMVERFAQLAEPPGAQLPRPISHPKIRSTALARKLAETGYAIWLFGSPKDHAIAEEIAQLAPGVCRNLCGATSLGQAIDLLALADFVVCNDSGLMHVAAALDRPLVTLYGSSSPGFTPPLSDQADILSLQLDCSPCFKRDCPLGHLHCLNKLLPEQVFSACLKRSPS